MSRSARAARYGALVERAARRRYGLHADHAEHEGVRVDAADDDGRPWDIKGALLTRRDARFRLWKDQHDYLDEHGGGYVFAGYRPVGRGVQVDRFRTLRAEDLDVDWYGAGGHRDGAAQVKIPVGAIL